MSLQQLLMDKRVGLKRYELDGRKVLFYFDEVSLTSFPQLLSESELWYCQSILHLCVCGAGVGNCNLSVPYVSLCLHACLHTSESGVGDIPEGMIHW